MRGGAKIWNGAKPYDTAAARVEPFRSGVGVNPTSKSIIAPLSKRIRNVGVIKASVNY